MVRFTIEILQLQYIDKVIDVGFAGPAISWGSVVEETAELPQLQLVELWTGRCMPVVCNDRCRGRCPGAVHRRWWTSLCCRSDKFQLSVLTAGMSGRFFRALYTGTGPGAVSMGARLP